MNYTSIKEMRENMSFDEKLILGVVRKHYNDYAGYNENSYSDTGETWMDNPSLTDCKEYIHDSIMGAKEAYQLTENGSLIESKHIRFKGSAWLKSAIDNYVNLRYQKDGWDFPHQQ